MGFFQAGSMNEECEKAAKILKGFAEKKKIPPEVINNAKGLAIFSGFRGGMYLAGAGGSGIVIARLADGTWPPPSAISVRSGSFGIVYGFDVYDCVCVLNTQATVDAYARPEVDMGMVAALGGSSKSQNAASVLTYTRSRGLYGGVTVEGTVIKERADINETSYGRGASSTEILEGDAKVREEGAGLSRLGEVLKQAAGQTADRKIVEQVAEEDTPGALE
ncbi:uncharacterized protein LTR77_010893 [Saxophila tyrrhenica]|uniref:Ysc84 actin-binding domain-containing protein n=1 Tax=Saxophila tyrrhenica TaxID=1690608 RepID=A0AAV9NTY8_9PEZI|nr:hypothetical protein LTR77_010893 [Saxophila tyrrhenica]